MTCPVAQADITPVLKPAGTNPGVKPLAKPTTAKSNAPATPKQPVRQQTVRQPVRQATVHTQTAVHTQTTTRTSTHTATHTAAVRPVTVQGGRKAPIARVTRHRISLPSLGGLFPTRLASVGQDSLPSYETWPSWVLGAFTLLASAEAFLLVRLGRSRRYQHEAALQQFHDR